ncbi:MAG: DUF1573 domain-containing protein [Niabella sp.]|nr:DUF1573 domain-containing protein [Niabella sp.]
MLLAVASYSCKSKTESDTTRPAIGEKKPDSNAAKIPQALADSANFTTIQWEDSTFRDLKKIKRGDSAVMKFSFVNTGNKPLLISGVEASCGCTVPEWPKEPVMPGKKGAIKAVFHTEVQPAATHMKQIFVNANTKPHTGHILTFKAEVTENNQNNH